MKEVLCLRKRHLCLRNRHMCLRKRHMCLRKRHLCLRKRHLCLRKRQLCLRKRHLCLRKRSCASERGTCASERGISASARGTFVSKKAFRVHSTKFVPRKMFCASHPGCQDATLSDTLMPVATICSKFAVIRFFVVSAKNVMSVGAILVFTADIFTSFIKCCLLQLFPLFGVCNHAHLGPNYIQA